MGGNIGNKGFIPSKFVQGLERAKVSVSTCVRSRWLSSRKNRFNIILRKRSHTRDEKVHIVFLRQFCLIPKRTEIRHN